MQARLPLPHSSPRSDAAHSLHLLIHPDVAINLQGLLKYDEKAAVIGDGAEMDAAGAVAACLGYGVLLRTGKL